MMTSGDPSPPTTLNFDWPRVPPILTQWVALVELIGDATAEGTTGEIEESTMDKRLSRPTDRRSFRLEDMVPSKANDDSRSCHVNC